MIARTVVLHYHLFKNAGTSLDRVLQRNFPHRWVTTEFDRQDNAAEVARWIDGQHQATAFSSHTANGPLPVLPGVRVISVLFLRDPIARIRSAYDFERQQDADTLGARLAKEHDLEGYVRARLAIPGDRQCRNFQSARLAAFAPGPEPEPERARRALGLLSVVGVVERFDRSLTDLAAAILPHFPDFQPGAVHANRSRPGEADGSEISEAFRRELEAENRLDIDLHRLASARLNAAAPGAPGGGMLQTQSH